MVIYMDNLIANNEVMTTLTNMKGINLMMTASVSEIKLAKEAAVKAASTVKKVAVAQDTTDTTKEADIAVQAEGTESDTVLNQADTEVAGTDVTETDTVEAEDVAVDDAVETDAAVGDEVSEEIIMDEATGKEAAIGGSSIDAGVNIDPAVMEGMNIDSGMIVDPGMPQAKDPLLASWPFVIGISSAVLIVSIVLGALLARRKIKKGIELYED